MEPLGFDLSAEAWDVCAPVWYRTSPGSRQHRGDAVAWTLSSKHSPAGVKKFGIINNRAFLFAVPDGLLMYGIPTFDVIDQVKALEKETGKKLVVVMSSGDWHHMFVRWWLEAFPSTKFVMSGLKFPTTRNGTAVLANPIFKKQIELVEGPTFPSLEKYASVVRFVGFNQCGIYADNDNFSKDGKNMKVDAKLIEIMPAMMKAKLDVRHLLVWGYHVPSRTMITEHNWGFFFTPQHHADLPMMMRMQGPACAFCSSLPSGFPNKPPTLEAAKKHVGTFTDVILQLDVRAAMDFHSYPGAMSRRWKDQASYVAEMKKELKKANEDDPYALCGLCADGTPKFTMTKTASTVGLAVVAPLFAVLSLLIGHFFNPCNAVNFPDVGGALSVAECEGMLQAAVDYAPRAKRGAAAELVFFFTLITRVEAACLFAISAAAIYALTQPFESRHPLLFLLAVLGTMLGTMDAEHAGFITLGRNAMLTDGAKEFAKGLTGLWAVTATLLWAGFWGSHAKAKAVAKAKLE